MKIDYSMFNNIKEKKDNTLSVNINKDELIEEIVLEAEAIQEKIKEFKYATFKKIENYMNETAKYYGSTFGEKGNLNITHSHMGYRVCKNIQNYLVLDEKLQIAKNLIDECLNKWSEGSNQELRKVINHAFSVDKLGRINIPRILSLRKLDIEDTTWQKAMRAITDSIDTLTSREFVRVYKKDKFGTYKNISLDIAKL